MSMKLMCSRGISNIVAAILFIVLLISTLVFLAPIISAQSRFINVGKEAIKVEAIKGKENIKAFFTYVNGELYAAVTNEGDVKSILDVLYLRCNETFDIQRLNVTVLPEEAVYIRIPGNKNNYTKALIITEYGNVFYIKDPETLNNVLPNNSSLTIPYTITSIVNLTRTGINLWSGNLVSTQIWYVSKNETITFINTTDIKYFTTWTEPAETSSYWSSVLMNENSFSLDEHIYLVSTDGTQRHWFIYLIKLPSSENIKEVLLNLTVAYYVKARTAADEVSQEIYVALADEEQLLSITTTTDSPANGYKDYRVLMERDFPDFLYIKRILKVFIPEWRKLLRSDVINYVVDMKLPIESSNVKYLAVIIVHDFITHSVSSTTPRYATYAAAVQINSITVR